MSEITQMFPGEETPLERVVAGLRKLARDIVDKESPFQKDEAYYRNIAGWMATAATRLQEQQVEIRLLKPDTKVNVTSFPGVVEPLASDKPYKGRISNWSKSPCDKGLGFVVKGRFLDHPELRGHHGTTSFVVRLDIKADGHHIETNNSRYLLVGGE